MVVDDNRDIADTTSEILQGAGYQVLAVYSAAEALRSMADFRPQLIISDVTMPEMGGIELARELRHSHPAVQVILLTGSASAEALQDVAEAGVAGVTVLAKPIPPRQLLKIIAEMTSSLT